MADNNENPSLNFSIEETFDVGTGSPELLKDLLAPESTTEEPGQVTAIETEEAPTQKKQNAPPQPKKTKTTAAIPPTEDEPDDETNKPDPNQSNVLKTFLDYDEEGKGDDDDPEVSNQTDDATPPSEDEPGEGQGFSFGALAKDLFKLGVFVADDDENEDEISIQSGEDFLERFNVEKRKGAIEIVNNFISRFGEDYQAAFEAIFVNGTNPKDYFGTYNNIVNFAELDMEDETNQTHVVRQMLEDQGYEKEDIATEIQRLTNYGDLQSVATKYHKVLLKKEATKLQELQEKAQRDLEQKAALKNQYIQNVNAVLQEKLKTKEFDGIPINPKLASELQDFLLVDKWKTSSGETITDFDRAILELKRPENHATKVKVALLLKILEKDPTLSTLQKRAVTQKTNQLFGEVARQASKSKTGGSGGNKPDPWF